MYPSLRTLACYGKGEVSLDFSKRVRVLWTACLIASLCGPVPALSGQGDSEVFEPGGPVRAPKLIHYVEPEFSGASKEAFVEGMVKISTVVTSDGTPTKCQVVTGLNAEEDRTAVTALKQWRFKPGTKDGKPVNVHVTVEVAFHLL